VTADRLARLIATAERLRKEIERERSVSAEARRTAKELVAESVEQRLRLDDDRRRRQLPPH
jgi:hypothetical protein